VGGQPIGAAHLVGAAPGACSRGFKRTCSPLAFKAIRILHRLSIRRRAKDGALGIVRQVGAPIGPTRVERR